MFYPHTLPTSPQFTFQASPLPGALPPEGELQELISSREWLPLPSTPHRPKPAIIIAIPIIISIFAK